MAISPGRALRRKIFTLTQANARWLKQEAARRDLSESALLRRLLEQAQGGGK